MNSKLVRAANIVFVLQAIVFVTLLILQLTSGTGMGGLGIYIALFLSMSVLTMVFVLLTFSIFIVRAPVNTLYKVALAANALLVFAFWYSAVF